MTKGAFHVISYSPDDKAATIVYSSGRRGAVVASLIPGINIIKMLLLGLGIWKDDGTVKSMSRFGNHRLLRLKKLFLLYI